MPEPVDIVLLNESKDITPINYMFRAECISDVYEFRKLFKDQIISINTTQDPMFPDVDVEFTSEASLHEIRRCMEKITDGHVMLETVNFASEYTGERYYDDY